jgi:hypothetical protein
MGRQRTTSYVLGKDRGNDVDTIINSIDINRKRQQQGELEQGIVGASCWRQSGACIGILYEKGPISEASHFEAPRELQVGPHEQLNNLNSTRYSRGNRRSCPISSCRFERDRILVNASAGLDSVHSLATRNIPAATDSLIMW